MYQKGNQDYHIKNVISVIFNTHYSLKSDQINIFNRIDAVSKKSYYFDLGIVKKGLFLGGNKILMSIIFEHYKQLETMFLPHIFIELVR
jgi:hypothetical protein